MNIKEELEQDRERKQKIMEQVRALNSQLMLLSSEGIKLEGRIEVLETLMKENWEVG